LQILLLDNLSKINFVVILNSLLFYILIYYSYRVIDLNKNQLKIEKHEQRNEENNGTVRIETSFKERLWVLFSSGIAFNTDL
jgi:hypothetical protein